MVTSKKHELPGSSSKKKLPIGKGGRIHSITITKKKKTKLFLQFEYVDWTKSPQPDWSPLPVDTEIEVLIGKNTKSCNSVSRGKTDVQGKVQFDILLPDVSTEFVFFKINCKDSSAKNMLPEHWTTFNHRAVDGTHGRLTRNDSSFGTSAKPLVFKIGFFYSMQLKYKDNTGVDYTVPEGIEIDVRLKISDGKEGLWIPIYQFDTSTSKLFQNNFMPTKHGTLNRNAKPEFLFSKSDEEFRTYADRLGESGWLKKQDYSKCCALVGAEGWLRFITFDLNEGRDAETKQKLFLTVHARLHDKKYNTEAIEFCEGVSASIEELVYNALVPYFVVHLDKRIKYTFEYERDVGKSDAKLYELKKTSPEMIPDSEKLLRSSLYHIKVIRFQNQIFRCLTGGAYKGIPDQVVKLTSKAFNAQRPFCPPKLGVELVEGNFWSPDLLYVIAHERGHGIMWHKLNISFARIAWEFIGGSLSRWELLKVKPLSFMGFIGGDYLNEHSSFYETNVETALYEGWADFCSMFTDWTDGSGMQGSGKGPNNVRLQDDKSWSTFPPPDVKVDQNPELANLGERCEGAISNFFWKIWEVTCGGITTYPNNMKANWKTMEHIDETVYTTSMCDKFQKYIWKPLLYFWYDRNGNCNLHDYWDPSIRDFVNAVVTINGISDSGTKKVLDLAHERCIARPELLSYLQLEYWHSKNRRWESLPDGIEVQVWDWDPISPNDLMGRGKTSGGKGLAKVGTPYKDEKEPDVFFKILTKGSSLPDGRSTPPSWSTQNRSVWRLDPPTATGKVVETKYKGYYDDYRRYYIGKPAIPGKLAQPEIFRFGKELEAHLVFEIWNDNIKKYQPFPAGWKVNMIDYDPVSRNDLLGSALLDSHGRCIITVDDKNEKTPDIFFEVHTDSRTVGKFQFPKIVSTMKISDHKGRPGYYEDTTQKEIGSSSDPLIFRFGKVFECFLRFEVENKGSRVSLPDGITIEAWDYDPLSRNDKIGEDKIKTVIIKGKTIGGFVHIVAKDKDEDKPDIFFIVRGGSRNVNGITIPDNWSTKDNLSTNGKKGYYDDFTGKAIGSFTTPKTFIIQ